MFDKLAPKKARRRHAIWYWMAFWFVFCIGILLGTNIALLVFASTSVVLLTLLEGFSSGLAYLVSLVIAALLALAFLVGYMWTFAGASSTYEAAKAYAKERGAGWWPQALVIGLELFFIALDLISLSYRRQFFSAKGADQLFLFFVVLSLLSPIIGLLMHILENKPLNFRLAEARQHGENLMGDDVYAAMSEMPMDRRTRVLMDPTGETLAGYFEEQQAIAQRERDEQLAEEEAKQYAKTQRKQKNDQANRPLPFPSQSFPGNDARMDRFADGRDPKATAQTSSQASRLSGNGYHP